MLPYASFAVENQDAILRLMNELGDLADGDLTAQAALLLMNDMVAAGRSLFVPDTARELQ